MPEWNIPFKHEAGTLTFRYSMISFMVITGAMKFYYLYHDPVLKKILKIGKDT